MLNLRHVQSFLAVVQAGSFHGAAGTLGIAQPTVSHHVHSLEAHLGVTLIERKGNGCRPTPAGRRLLPQAEALVRLSQRAVAAVAAGRPLRIGAASNIGIYLLQPLLRRFRESHRDGPDIEVDIHPNPEVVRRLEDAEIDLALTEWRPASPGLVTRRWGEQALVAIAAPDHPWARHRVVTPEILADTPLLAGEPGSGTGRLLREYLAGLGRTPPIAAQLGSTEAVKQAVAHGLGVSLVLEGCIRADVAAGRLVALPLASPGLRKTLWASWPGQGEPPPLRGSFLELLGAAA